MKFDAGVDGSLKLDEAVDLQFSYHPKPERENVTDEESCACPDGWYSDASRCAVRWSR